MDFQVVIVGAGHAGIEAALACARMGLKTACLTLRLDRIGHLPCNCSIGGPGKGPIAREVDALGGQMAVTTDHTLTHIRRVGTSKGPAVQTLRAQVCKHDYPIFMQGVMHSQENLTLLEGQATWVTQSEGKVTGIQWLPNGSTETQTIACQAVVLTTGTFLNGLCHMGSTQTVAARHGDQAVSSLSDFLAEIGLRLRRFKTGTTPRIKLSSIRLDRTDVMPSEIDCGPLSFRHDAPMPKREMVPTWQTRTLPATHEYLTANLAHSAMYSGQIEGVGPRYCPSIEDKVVRFAGKDSHPIFLEQEEWDSESVYVQGFSTSMPGEIQLAALRTIPGLEDVEMIRPGYAVEYDMADPLQLRPTLMSRQLDGLFLAGQINGTSGYEEAAGQGIAAGINAALYATEQEPLIFPRSESLIGVMIDDLVTKGVEDPYRMLTARAEHRLLLRHDNADFRLTPLGRSLGIVDDLRWERFNERQEGTIILRTWMEEESISEPQSWALEEVGMTPVRGRASYWQLLTRPGASVSALGKAAAKLGHDFPALDLEAPTGTVAGGVRELLEIESVYGGYLKRQEEEATLARRMEEMHIPDDVDWDAIKCLSHEGRQKLGEVQPATIGQASRIPGLRPTDVAYLIGHIRHQKRQAAWQARQKDRVAGAAFQTSE